MNNWLIRNAQVVNEGRTFAADVLLRDGFIERVAEEGITDARGTIEVDATGKHLLPGCIDDQVHFREPGLTHKDDIAHGSAAAVAGGITSFMEMPNTVPQALTQQLLADKYVMGAATSVANFSFFMGVGNSNIDEVLRTDPRTVCGLKAFLGSSTGDMLVDDERALDRLFREAHLILAVHAEHEPTVKANLAKAIAEYGENIPVEVHPVIRDAEACYRSSSAAVARAREHGTRLHVLHISTARELELFTAGPLKNKRITAEACIHHLWFDEHAYQAKGTLVKWNPAIKTGADRSAIRQAVLDDRIDVIATDHAPHTLEEKALPYAKCPSGAPMVQHALVTILELVHQGVITLERVVEKMCHAPARLFDVSRRGYIREGHHADLVLVDLSAPWAVSKANLLYKCGWSPLEGQRFQSRVLRTWVNGNLVWDGERVNTSMRGQRLLFDR
ncbi:MAG: dihydroorotase [Flavobacteriales bacterium]|nr:dihydroorotase [Flavobacteriales bacterium]MBK7553048.1 dihydroorotase [Flavobacteriales bacterium]MBP6575066.1 dihydroorotase [Flavobacteriales bacterium]